MTSSLKQLRIVSSTSQCPKTRFLGSLQDKKSYSDNKHYYNQLSNAFSFPHFFHLQHLPTSPYISTTSFKIQESGWDNSRHLIDNLDMSLLKRNYFTSDSAKLAVHFNHKNIIPREIHIQPHTHTSEHPEPKKYSPQSTTSCSSSMYRYKCNSQIILCQLKSQQHSYLEICEVEFSVL